MSKRTLFQTAVFLLAVAAVAAVLFLVAGQLFDIPVPDEID
jgi:hypothetical protein